MRVVRKAIPVLVVLIVFAGLLMMQVQYYAGRRPSRYLIPMGYKGIVKVEYGVPGAPSCSIEDGFTLIRVAASGIVRTSTPFAYGLGDPPEYYYVDGANRRRLYTGVEPSLIGKSQPTPMIQGSLVGRFPQYANRTMEYFFVGINKEFLDYVAKHPNWHE